MQQKQDRKSVLDGFSYHAPLSDDSESYTIFVSRGERQGARGTDGLSLWKRDESAAPPGEKMIGWTAGILVRLAGRSRHRVIGGVGVAAWFLYGRELHDFDARPVRVVGVETIFAVAADLRAVECFQPA